jgi:hypothetical protein
MEGNLGSLLARCVLRNSIERRRMFVAKHAPDFFDLVGLEFKVRLTMRKTRFASSRSASSLTASDAALP